MGIETSRVVVSRRSFAAGFAAGLCVVALLALTLLMVISSPSTQQAAPPRPNPTTSPPAAPESVGTGETWLGDVELSSSTVITADGALRDVTATGSGVTLTADGLRADRLHISANLPFDTAAEQIGEGIELYAAGELAGLRRSVELLGRRIDIDATGRVRAEGGRLVIEPESVDLGSLGWIDSIASAAVRSLVTIRHTVTGIPAGMRLDAVGVGPNGFAVDLSGTDVRIGS